MRSGTGKSGGVGSFTLTDLRMVRYGCW
jgi:hypothetical protein